MSTGPSTNETMSMARFGRGRDSDAPTVHVVVASTIDGEQPPPEAGYVEYVLPILGTPRSFGPSFVAASSASGVRELVRLRRGLRGGPERTWGRTEP